MSCRVCLRRAEQPLHIFQSQLDIVSILQKHFWFKLLQNDGFSELICKDCWLKTCNFHEFYVEIENVHSKKIFEIQDVKVELFGNCWHDCQYQTLNQIKNPLYEPEVIVSNNLKNRKSIGASSIGKRLDFTEEICVRSHLNKDCGKNVATPKHKSTTRSTKAVKILKTEAITRCKRIIYQNERFIDDEIIKKHISMDCVLCSFVGSDFNDIIQHFRLQHPGEKPYVLCCNRKLSRRYVLLQHAIRHENPEYFKCSECNKILADASVLRQHITTNHSNKKKLMYVCDQCPKRFSRPSLLENHKPFHIPVNEWKYVCDKCPQVKTFASEKLLLTHVYHRHTKSGNVCHVCAKEIRDKYSFEKHLRLHFKDSGPRVKCPQPGCDRWLKDTDNLKEHMRRHNLEGKIYTCEKCGKICKNRRTLTSHLNYAHSNAEFTCKICQKSFKRAITLKEHMAQHTGVSLYKCPFCARTFNSNANMHSHKKKMHPIEWDAWRKTKRGSSQQVINKHLGAEYIANVKIN